MASIWDMLFPGASQAPQFADPNGNPNAQLPVPFPGPQQAPWLPQTTPWPQDAAPLTAQQRYRASQAGDESRMPQFQRTGPTLPEAIGQSMLDTGRMMTTAPPAMPRGAYMDAGGPAQGTADPQAFANWLGEMRQRGELAPSMALGMIGGGTAFAPRSALGSAGTKMLQPAAEATAEAAQPGIRAYHGSPHDFTQFDLSKIGTGEGAQAYGHGLYMAENEAVAKQYRDALSRKRKLVGDEPLNPTSVPHAVAELVDEHGGDIAAARNTLMKEVPTNDQERQMLTEALNLLNRGNIPKITPAPIKGHMYEVNIGAHPEQFLDWDKPLSEQSEHIRSLLQQPTPPQGLRHTLTGQSEMSGGLGQGPSAVDQANRLVDAPPGRIMGQGMGSMVNKGEVGNPVVGLDPVNMVDILRRQQVASQMRGHDPPMFLGALPVERGNDIALGIHGASSPKVSVTGTSAEGPGVSGHVVGGPVKSFPALTANDLGQMTVPQLLQRLGSRDAATQALRDQGVAGIRYLDQGSRAAGEGSRNYVVFDPKTIEILRKYGIAGLLSSGAASQLPIPPQKAPVF